MLSLPKHIEYICQRLEENGFASYAVGGAVRDLLMGRTPGDYDVTTAALPEDVKRIFPRTADTGLAHGTVTVILSEGICEVTTFRADGPYKDGRHPEGVTFVPHIEGDLQRRDFTVNAMAFSPTRGFCDPFSGRADLERKILRTVGEAEARFSEDALRILRLYRFSAQLSFSIEEKTDAAARKLAPALKKVSRERIFAELSKMLFYADGKNLENTEEILKQIIPFSPKGREVYDKAAKCRHEAGKWARLLGENGAAILASLRAPRALVLSVGELAAYKSGKHIVADVAGLRHTSAEVFFDYLDDKEAFAAFAAAKNMGVPTHMGAMPVSGNDLISIGFTGREIGKALEALFMYAIENPGNNSKEKLMEVANWIYKQHS